MQYARKEEVFLALSTKEKHLYVQYFHMNERFSYGEKRIAQCNCVGQDIFWQSATDHPQWRQARKSKANAIVAAGCMMSYPKLSVSLY